MRQSVEASTEKHNGKYSEHKTRNVAYSVLHTMSETEDAFAKFEFKYWDVSVECDLQLCQDTNDNTKYNVYSVTPLFHVMTLNGLLAFVDSGRSLRTRIRGNVQIQQGYIV